VSVIIIEESVFQFTIVSKEFLLQNKPIFNYSVAFDRGNSVPLLYEVYPGSIVDISQLQFILGKAESYDYIHIGFIL